MEQTKNEIKNRMLQTAAKAWKLQGQEQEHAFDPLVSMLLNACAAEIEKIYRNGSDIQYRLLELLAGQLLPGELNSAVPAHAVVQAYPNETTDFLIKNSLFSATAGSVSGAEKPVGIDLPFMPTIDAGIHQAQVVQLIAGNSWYAVVNDRFKELMSEGQPHENSFWIGIKTGEKLQSMQNILFYFETGNNSKESIFYSALKEANWFVNGNPVISNAGFGKNVCGENNSLSDYLFRKFDNWEEYDHTVNRFYKRHFVQLPVLDISKEMQHYFPPEIMPFFDAGFLEKLDTKLLWVQVKFPGNIYASNLKEIMVYLNCFPVVNRELKSFSHRLHKKLNIVPLQAGSLFFGLKKVSDSNGTLYQLHEAAPDASQMQPGTVVLRKAGVGRFSKRDAAELVREMTDVLIDESARFSALSMSDISPAVNDLNRILAELHDKTSGYFQGDAVQYLLINTAEELSHAFVEYFVTNGTAANQIKAGTMLQVRQGAAVKGNAGLFITTTTGGMDVPGKTAQMRLFSKLLFTKNKVVTEEDIRRFCFQSFGNRISRVTVHKGIEAHPHDPKQGYVRVILITVFQAEADRTAEEEWQYLMKQSLFELEAASSGIFPFKLTVKKRTENV